MLFYEAVEHPKKDLLSSARRLSDTNPMSPVTSDGDKLSQLQVHWYYSWFYYKWIIKASLPTCTLYFHCTFNSSIHVVHIGLH